MKISVAKFMDKPIKRVLPIWLAIMLPAFLVVYLEPLTQFDFRFHRTLILDGEWWRLLSGHLDHIGWVHLALNAIFLALILFIFDVLKQAAFTVVLWFVSALGISLCLLLLSPELIWYVGLSSSLYALLVYGIMLESRLSFFVRIVAVALVFAKVGFEQGGSMPWVSELISGPVAEISHLYGAVMGFILAAGVVLLRRPLKQLLSASTWS